MTQAAGPLSELETESARRRTERILEAFHEEEAFGRSYDLALLKRLWPFFVPYRRLIWRLDWRGARHLRLRPGAPAVDAARDRRRRDAGTTSRR